MTLDTGNTAPARLLSSLLDAGYTEAFNVVANSFARLTEREPLRTSIRQFRDEAQRLNEAGERMTPDNPVVRALIADLEDVMQRQAGVVENAVDAVQGLAAERAETFVEQTTGIPRNLLIEMGWNQTDPEAVRALVDAVAGEEFADYMAQFGEGIADQVRTFIVRGLVEGRNPLMLAEELVDLIPGISVSRAQMLMRTLMLNAFRDAAVVSQLANADIIETVIRIAALDGRTCLACWALHGTELEIGQRVDDHPNGRCVSIVKIEGRPLNVPRGPQIFNDMLAAERNGTLSARQRAILDQMRRNHGASMRALEGGAVALQDFVGRQRLDVFGEIVQELSLRGILGAGAQQFYENKP